MSSERLKSDSNMEELRTDKVHSEEEEGASMIEYVLMVVFVAILALAAVRFFGQAVSSNFSEIAESVCPAFGCTP